MAGSIETLSQDMREAILGLDKDRAVQLAQEILAAGGNPNEIINTVIRPTADELGQKFDCGEFFLPQLLLSGEALEAAMTVFLDALPHAQHRVKRLIVIGTVRGDIHTIGKNTVAMVLRTGGFQVQDLGVDVDSKAFVQEAVSRNADMIALSSLLTTTLPYQRDVIDELKARGLRDRFKVIVGGGPASQSWADEIGADGYGKDATDALAVVRRLLGEE